MRTIYLVLIACLCFCGTVASVDYQKNPDGTVTETKTVTADRLAERLAEVEKLLEWNNARVAVMTKERSALLTAVNSLNAHITTHSVVISELEDEKAKIEAVVK